MANAVDQLNGLTIAHAKLAALANGDRMTVDNAVHDGDTVKVDPDGNISTRFLGIDTPEVSFTLPDAPKTFRPISSAQWTTFLTDPFAAGQPLFDPPLAPALIADLQTRLGPDCATNHAAHAAAATQALKGMIETDRTQNGDTLDTFKFFLAFATDVIDRYGRFLAYLNRDTPNPPRPLTYNERLLAGGWAVPYFIWPNINPFRAQPSLTEAVPTPGQPINDPSLDRARQSVRDARAAHAGIFEVANPLALLPFELRFLARVTKRGAQQFRSGPERWVIDLTADNDQLLAPYRYTEIPHAEDRLFVPAEYTPLFIDKGWIRS
jgi:endonuclease YncB( thermonuclease family)